MNPMNRRAAIAIFYAILLACTAAVFLPVRHFQFVNWDDRDMVVENPLLNPPTIEHLREIWSGPHLDLYTPLSYSLWWGLAWTSNGSSDAARFHLLNLFLHALAASLVFSILLRCVKIPLAAFAGAAVFALHPMQVESVAWVAGMNNLLAGALALAAIRLYLVFADAEGKRRWFWYCIASAIFLLALLAKPTAVVVPLIVAILDIGIVGRPIGRVIRSSLPWFCMAAIMSIVAQQAQPFAGTAIWHRPFIALDALGFYFHQVFWPTRLSIDYARTPARVWNSHQWIINGCIPLFIALLVWPMRRGRRQLFVAGSLAVAALIPTLGLIPFSQQRYSTVADRYFYLAMLGPALLVAWALTRVSRSMALLLAPILIYALMGLTAIQLQTWRNTDALAGHVLAIDPNSTVGNKIKAAEYSRIGKSREAIPFYRAAMIRNPDDADLHLNLANAFYHSSEYAEAIPEYEAAIRLPSRFRASAMLDLGWAYVKSGQPDQAAKEFQQILQIDPYNLAATESLRQLSSLRVRTP
jgi:tetratricopeptide (TPR) repeat protein